MLIISPVDGLRPWRACRFDAEKEPNPGHVTLSPCLRAVATVSKRAPTTRSAVAWSAPDRSATAATNSAFVMGTPLLWERPRLGTAPGMVVDGGAGLPWGGVPARRPYQGGQVLELTGRTAVVTGGASGIGAGVVAELQQRGLRVVSLDVARGGPAELEIECDVGDEASVERAVAGAVEHLGGLHYAVCNAGVAGMAGVLS